MEPLAKQNVLINGYRISYGVFGTHNSKSNAIVLLHGTPASSLIWRNVVPILVDAGYQVYLYDLLGFGTSERPWDQKVDTSMSGQVPILLGLLDHWGLEKPYIVAHDIGGGIAQRLGIFHPERAKTITLIDCVSYDSYPSPRTRQQMQNGLDSLIREKDENHRAHFREWLLSAVHDKEKFANSSLDTLLEYISGPIGQPSLFQHQVRHYDPKHTDLPYEKLGQLPLQLIWGANDIWQVTDWAHRLHNDIPGSELHVLEDCGHFCTEDEPEKISDLVLTFLKKHATK